LSNLNTRYQKRQRAFGILDRMRDAALERFSAGLEWRTPFHVVDRARTMPGSVRPLAKGEYCGKCPTAEHRAASPQIRREAVEAARSGITKARDTRSGGRADVGIDEQDLEPVLAHGREDP
jgi:hypothetical protein